MIAYLSSNVPGEDTISIFMEDKLIYYLVYFDGTLFEMSVGFGRFAKSEEILKRLGYATKIGELLIKSNLQYNAVIDILKSNGFEIRSRKPE